MIACENIREKGTQKTFEKSFNKFSNKVSDIHLHIDLDVHDPELAPVSHLKPKGGLTPDEVQEAARTISNKFNIVSCVIAIYNPDCDPEKKGFKAGLDLISLMGELVS